MSNKFENVRIEFHILQSFPVSCLNRDDVGAPKSAIVGGVQRARVSSQCWKRAVRMEMHNLGVKTASRTRLVTGVIAEQCIALGATQEQADACGEAFAKAFTKTVKDKVSDTLFFLAPSEAEAAAKAFAEKAFDPASFTQKDIASICKNTINPVVDGLDLALFGRMLASAPDMNVEAAASFSHAISTHKASAEVEFFTAVDDRNTADDTGSGHMGSLEFNAATYYRYVSLDLGQLAENLKSDANTDIADAVVIFAKALFLAVPSARQNSMSAASPWDFATITVRKGQRVQLAFTDPVTAKQNESILQNSKKTLCESLEKIKTMYGSLFGLLSEFKIGADSNLNIDSLSDGLRNTIESIGKE